eukprot:scaffold15537_cov170-Amphora_coffeaeformis.AAC.3
MPTTKNAVRSANLRKALKRTGTGSRDVTFLRHEGVTLVRTTLLLICSSRKRRLSVVVRQSMKCADVGKGIRTIRTAFALNAEDGKRERENSSRISKIHSIHSQEQYPWDGLLQVRSIPNAERSINATTMVAQMYHLGPHLVVSPSSSSVEAFVAGTEQ